MNKKPVRTRGKLKLSRYFQKFKKGESVSVIIEPSVHFSLEKNLQGKTGTIEKKQGKVYVVKINDHKKEKNYLIAPIHLKKIKEIKKINKK